MNGDGSGAAGRFRRLLSLLRRPAHRLQPTATVVAALGIGLACSGDASPGRDTAGVEIHIRWDLQALPGAEVSVHEALPGDVEGVTESVAAGEAIELGPLIPDGTLKTGYDEPVRFVLVVRNRTSEPMRFWVPPHLALPIEAEPDLVIHCLCVGVQYEVPAGGAWRRVLSYGLSRRSEVREPLAITHVLVAGDLPAP